MYFFIFFYYIFTGILAALASSSSTMKIALQLAFCHLFFNITGILLFYPIPKMRQVVLGGARFLGKTTAQYRWFAIAYVICMFVLFPGFFFGMSWAGQIPFTITLSILCAIALFVVILNVFQKYKRETLPVCLQTWNFLPEYLRSLAPYDRLLGKCAEPLSKVCCSCCVEKCSCLKAVEDDSGFYIDSDSDICDESAMSSYLPSAVSSKANLSKYFNDSAKIYRPKNSQSGNSSPDSGSYKGGATPMEIVDIKIVSRDSIENTRESVI